MRLTLRTLLSYIDDTLDASEAKLIGEKVTESDIAPPLIERIKKVTRRRGLASPPVTGDGEVTSDPNTVAEYLDNVLTSDQLAEVEKAALDSDEHLAEIAACHQILTLVLGEPAKVPPTARQRMYRLVKGRESIPYRKIAPSTIVAGVSDPARNSEEHAEADETLLLGMTSTRLLLPMACALVIVVLLIAVIWMAIPPPQSAAHQGYIALSTSRLDKDVYVDPLVKKDLKKPVDTIVAKDTVVKKNGKQDVVVAKVKFEIGPPPRLVETRPILTPVDKPDATRRAYARFEDKDVLLLQRQQETNEWERASPGKKVFTADTTMSLPGMHCTLTLESGVKLVLWGSLPQFHAIPVLDIQESRVVLHEPGKGFDADFTLESGRVFLSRPAVKGVQAAPAKVRMRFKDEIWDLTLFDGDSEVCLDLLGFYAEGVPFSKQPGGPAPKTEVYFALLKGQAGLRVKFKEHPLLQAPTRVDWDSVVGEITAPEKIKPTDMEWWNKTMPEQEGAKQMKAAIASFTNRLNKPDEAKIDVIFYSAMQDVQEQPNRRAYAVHCLQALDAIEYLAEALSDDFFIVREVGIRAVQHWTGLAADRDLKVYNLLIDKKSFTEAQAQAVMQLMHPFSAKEQQNPEIVAALFDTLKNEKITVRELGYLHLSYIDPNGAREVGFFDAGAPETNRNELLQKWKASWKKRFIDKKK